MFIFLSDPLHRFTEILYMLIKMTLLMTSVRAVSFVLVQLVEIRRVCHLSYGNYPPVKAAMVDTVE